MGIASARSLIVAMLGLVVAALLAYAVVSWTVERDLLSSVPEDVGVSLTPGPPGSKSMRKPEGKPVVVGVSADGTEVVKAGGGAAPLPEPGSGNGRIAAMARSADD